MVPQLLIFLALLQVVSASYVPIRRLDDQLGNCFFTTSDVEMNQLINNVSSGYKYTSTIGYLDTISNDAMNLPFVRYLDHQQNISLSTWTYSTMDLQNDWTTNDGFMGYCSENPYPGSVQLYFYIDSITGSYVLFTGCSGLFNINTEYYTPCYVYGNDSITTTACTTTAESVTSTITLPTTTITTTTLPITTTTITLSTAVTTTEPTTTPITTTAPATTATTTTIPTSTTPMLPHVAIYRFLIGTNHFYTNSQPEYAALLQNTANKFEGIAGYMILGPQVPSTVPFYRLSYSNGAHMYATEAEKNSLVANGWKNEGILGHCSPTAQPGMTQLHRFYYTVNYDHLFTANPTEINYLIVNGPVGGWNDEGIICYIYSQ